MMITIIAEKPSVARDIAKVLGANQSKDGYITGNGYNVTYAFGHLVGLAEPIEYGYSEKWVKTELPILPESFKLRENKDAKKQLGVIRNLIKDSSSLIAATDAGREGELIFRWIYDYINIKKPFKRLWISDMTDKSIKDGFNNLLDGNVKDSLFLSAKARAESDWMIGINSTRLLSINNSSLISIGRVQTPTLRLIVDRYLENKNFVATDYWKAYIVIDNNNSNPEQNLKLLNDIVFEKEEKAKEFIETISKTKNVTVKREDKKEKESAPKLYSLTSLQKDANNKLDFTADDTLKILQGLYETHKLVTYPRTDSEYLTENQIDDVMGILISHKLYFENTNVSIESVDKNAAFDSRKVTDHHAVIPTNIVPSENILAKLNSKEKELYNLIISRFYQRFSPACEKNKTILTVEINSEIFKYIHTEELYEGWKIYVKRTDAKNFFKINITDNQTKEVLEHNYSKYQTQPKPIFTEANLLDAMETAGKEIDDEDLREQMKGKGLGTPATRSGIIEILVKRSFIERKGKKLIPTNTGADLIDKIRQYKISVPEWTAAQEYELYKIEKGEVNYNNYIQQVKEITKGIMSELDDVIVDVSRTETEVIGQCPKCQKGNIKEGNKGYGCSEWKAGCDFVIWKEVSKKKLPIGAVKALISNGTSELIKGFTSTKGTKFDAFLVLNKEDFKLSFLFEKTQEENSINFGFCPKCKSGNIVEFTKGWKCSKERNICDFVIWKTISQKNITSKQVQSLLANGITEKIKGFKSSAGKGFEAQLSLNSEFKIEFKF